MSLSCEMVWRQKSNVALVSSAVVLVFLLTNCYLIYSRGHFGPSKGPDDGPEEDLANRFETRLENLRAGCAFYGRNPFRPEYAGLNQHDKSFGSEVIVFKGPNGQVVRVCVPHKVGSHAWGQFSRSLSAENKTKILSPNDVDENEVLNVIVVRHPLDRLVSVYRMIFEDWCDPDKFLAKQWDNVCKINPDGSYAADSYRVNNDELLRVMSDRTSKAKEGMRIQNFLSHVMNEHMFGNDRYIKSIWQHFHPHERLTDPRAQLRFSFPEFVRFLVNGSQEMAPEVTEHVGLSYHWAPVWQECQLCTERSFKPDLVIKMETLSDDLKYLMFRLGLEPNSTADQFPHTHGQSGGHSSEAAVRKNYFSTLNVDQLEDLLDLYKLDMQFFGYSAKSFLNLAKS